MFVLFLIGLILGIWHLFNWLITKGIIFVMFQLFNVNWYGKFWVVYLFLVLVGTILKSCVTVNKKGD
jgi:hypothetical protein